MPAHVQRTLGFMHRRQARAAALWVAVFFMASVRGARTDDVDTFVASRVKQHSTAGATTASPRNVRARTSAQSRGSSDDAARAHGHSVSEARYRRPHTFVRSFDHAIPPSLRQRLLKDATVQQQFSAASSQLKFGKKTTYWYATPKSVSPRDGSTPSRDASARFATEEAIEVLKRVGFAEGEFVDRGIVGAEWWYQVIPPGGSIGFHYDKDEAVASDEMRMVLPAVSTITYLTPHGGPTVVLNMTTDDGNRNHPAIAAVGFLSYPVVDRHTMFDGRMMHGVLPVRATVDRDSNADAHDSHRVTLLVNWWHRTPLPPNCRTLNPTETEAFVRASGSPSPSSSPLQARPSSHKNTRHNGLWSYASNMLSTALGYTEGDGDGNGGRGSGGYGGGDDESAPTGQAVQPTGISANNAGGGADVMIKIALETHFLWIPHSAPAVGFGRVRWNGTQSLGGVIEVDMTDDRVARQVATTREPKLVYFVPQGGLSGAKQVFFPAVKRLKHTVRAYVAEWGSRSAVLWDTFGLRESDAPVAGIEDPNTGERYIMRYQRHSSADITRFVADFAAGKLTRDDAPPLPRRRSSDEL